MRRLMLSRFHPCGNSFFADLDRLFDPRFKPVMQDILRVRVKTSGISETKFESGGLFYSWVGSGCRSLLSREPSQEGRT